jgi:ribosomal protein S18 acetylase RimI-like enzyme
MTAGDLTTAARLHCAAFPESLLSRLGVSLVTSYYNWQLQCGASSAAFRALVAERGGEVCGFVVGGRYQGATSGFVWRYWRVLAVALLRNADLLFSQTVREKIASVAVSLVKVAVGRRRKPPAPTEAPSFVPSFGILALAVAPSREGSGVGRALMAEMVQAARTLAFPRMNLTVNPDNVRAVAFYERGGWRRYPDNPWCGGMVLPLEPGQA